MGMQPILSITVPVKNIKGTSRQCYGDGDGVVRCEQTIRVNSHLRFIRRELLHKLFAK